MRSVMPRLENIETYCALAYWIPLSEWWINTIICLKSCPYLIPHYLTGISIHDQRQITETILLISNPYRYIGNITYPQLICPGRNKRFDQVGIQGQSMMRVSSSWHTHLCTYLSPYLSIRVSKRSLPKGAFPWNSRIYIYHSFRPPILLSFALIRLMKSNAKASWESFSTLLCSTSLKQACFVTPNSLYKEVIEYNLPSRVCWFLTVWRQLFSDINLETLLCYG